MIDKDPARSISHQLIFTTYSGQWSTEYWVIETESDSGIAPILV